MKHDERLINALSALPCHVLAGMLLREHVHKGLPSPPPSILTNKMELVSALAKIAATR